MAPDDTTDSMTRQYYLIFFKLLEKCMHGEIIVKEFVLIVRWYAFILYCQSAALYI